MARNAQEILEEASALDERERARLAGLLLESLEPPADMNVEAAWAAEIERRLEELDSGRVMPIPWSEVKAELFRS